MSDRRPIPLAYPFRLFFLLTGVFGALVIPAWLAMLLGVLPAPTGLLPPLWHSHEMLYGLAPAAIAGFLLTAMSNWTGTPPPTGGPLLALGLLWLAGRVALALAGVLPGPLVALVDLAFLPTLALYALRVLLRAGNTRNLPLIVILAVLTLGNGLMHLALLGNDFYLGRLGELVALDTLVLLMAVIGGRIAPAFTRNWLAQRSRPPAVRVHPRLDRLALTATALMLPADLLAPTSTAAGAIALIAGMLLALRVIGWQGWRTWSDPLMWILHVGYAWLALALVLKGMAPWVGAVTASTWFHTLGIGAMGTLIAGVMTRVAVGHTGRRMALPRGASSIYWMVIAAALLRLAHTMGAEVWTLHAAACAWTAAFVLFLVFFGPILTRPRVDGRPG